MSGSDTLEQAWRIEQGERETMTFPVENADGLFPIDGWDIEATIKTRPGGQLLYTFPAEHIVFDPDDNTVQLVIPGPVSALWTWTTGRYKVMITNPDTDPNDPATYRVLQGPLVIDPD